MTGNVRIASEGQLDELRIAVSRSMNRLRGKVPAMTAQAWIGDNAELDKAIAQLLYFPAKKSLKMIFTIDDAWSIADFLNDRDVSLNRLANEIFLAGQATDPDILPCRRFAIINRSALKHLSSTVGELFNNETLFNWSKTFLDGYILQLCELGDLPACRATYRDQPLNTTVDVAMSPIAVSRENSREYGYAGFNLHRTTKGQYELSAYRTDPSCIFHDSYPNLLFRCYKADE